ncbi:MAG: hypothetical protein EA412_03955 [Chitinophagaceae bacterium]|nr:MAG: hypothetical protein EA412_03955 [Chitinophagaceae bacterium]
MHFSPHIAIQVREYEKAVVFFKDFLKMEIKSYHANETHFKLNNINFYIENNPACRTYFEFFTSEMESTIKELEASGCQARETKTPENKKSYLVYTPFGFNFHLWEKESE